MTIWHPFQPNAGHRSADATQDAPSDLPSWITGPWTPQALAETQLDMWRHAAAATHAWWQYMTVAWPAWPVADPSAGAPVATPPESVVRTDLQHPTGEDLPAPAAKSTRIRSTAASAKRAKRTAR